MKSLIIVFGALILIIATPFVFGAIDDGRSDELTQNFAGVSTGSGLYAANVTLSSAAYNDSINAIQAVSSNETGVDAPSASSYNDVSHALEVSGLEESTTRTLSIIYLVDSDSLESGMSSFLTLLRWFWVFIIVGMCGGAVYAFFD